MILDFILPCELRGGFDICKGLKCLHQRFSHGKPGMAEATSTHSSLSWLLSKKIKFTLSALAGGFFSELCAFSAAFGKFFQTFHPLGILFLACANPAYIHSFYKPELPYFNLKVFLIGCAALGQMDSECQCPLALHFSGIKSRKPFSLSGQNHLSFLWIFIMSLVTGGNP